MRDGHSPLPRFASRVPGAVLFLLSLTASTLLLQRQPLAALGGLTDEWFPLGVNVALHSTLGWGETPIVLRPPGYPFFVAGVLRLGFEDVTQVTPERLPAAAHLVYVAQALLLAVTTVVLYAWLRRRVGVAFAFAGAFTFGVNPYSLLLVSLLHYDVVHLFFVVAATAYLGWVLDRPIRASWALFGCGVAWGLTTLVRPTTLLLPPFVLLMLLLRTRPAWRRTLGPALAFSLGMAIAIAPWTARNYAVTGRVIPTNAQGWTVLWASTIAPLRLDPNRYQWREVALKHGGRVYSSVTGEADYSYPVLIRDNLPLEAAYKAEAIRNIREDPRIYLRNALRSLVTLHFQINSALVSSFERIQTPGVTVSQAWFWGESAEYLEPTLASRSVKWLFALLTLLALGGAVAAVRGRDRFALAPGGVWACFAVAHALTHMDFMYYYMKLPFLAVFAALGLARLEDSKLALDIGTRRLSLAHAIAGLLVAWCVVGVITLV